MASLQIWIGAARPRTLGAAVAPVLVGTAMAYEARGFHGLAALAALLGAVLIQIGANFANDYFDFMKGADTADRIGPTRATAAGLISPAVMRRAMVLTFALVFVPGAYILYRGGAPFLVIGLVSIACGLLYTGGPFPLAYLGLGDIFVLVFFGPVAVGGTYYLQVGTISAEVLIAGLGPGLLSTAILTVNNLRDIETDRVVAKKTLAVRFGMGFARCEYYLCIFGAAIVVPVVLVVAHGAHPAVLTCALVFAMAMRKYPEIVKQPPGPHLNAILAYTGKLVILFSILFSIAWLL